MTPDPLTVGLAVAVAVGLLVLAGALGSWWTY